MLNRPLDRLVAVLVAIVIGGALAGCESSSLTEVHVKTECRESMFLHAFVIDPAAVKPGITFDFDTARYAEPFLDEYMGEFDLENQRVEIYIARTSPPHRPTGPFVVTAEDLEPMYPGDDAPVTRFVIPEDQCPTADDPAR